MRLLVFGGTSEGRNLAFALEQQNHDVTVSVATQYGADIMGDASRVRIVYGRKDADGIKELISGMDAVIDATHPYAKEVTGLIFKACSDCGIA